MIDKNLLPELIEEFQEKLKLFEYITHRLQKFPKIPHKIKVALGMRRTGKTVFLFQEIFNLLKNNISINQILYINFEDDRISPLSIETLRELLDNFYTLYPENHENKCYLFFDEIQNIENWQTIIRRYSESKNVEIYLTGSSAKLLSKEIATSLRGRSISVEITPFNFQEYLNANKIKIDTKLIGKKSFDNFLKHFKNYLHTGGFPEIINLQNHDRIRILQDYVNVVIFRDIVERHKITHISLIKYLIKILLKNAAGSFSVNKFYNDMKSQGFAVGKMTLHEYLSYIEDAYLIYTVPLYSESIRKTETNPKKIYAVDTGLINAYTMSHSENLGHCFENLIYLDLRRKYYEVFYYLTQERYEIDFVAKDLEGNIQLIQVAWDTKDTQTLERETRALRTAEKELGVKGVIITAENYLDWLQTL